MLYRTRASDNLFSSGNSGIRGLFGDYLDRGYDERRGEVAGTCAWFWWWFCREGKWGMVVLGS